MRIIVAAALSACVAGCSTTPADLEAKSAPAITAFTENYQEIYRRTSGLAKRCIASSMGPYASMAVDADLFPDLGYGEITVSLINWGVRNYYVSSRIEKVPTGSKLIVRAGNTLGAERMIQLLQRWAGGDQSCT